MTIKKAFGSVSSRFIFGAGLLALSAVFMSSPSLAKAATISTYMQVGSKGADVTSLQTFLAQDRMLYPQGMVTGYFGSLTKDAVMNFQLRNEIPSVGRVGPMTLPVINYQMANGIYLGMGTGVYQTNTSGDVSAPLINSLTVSPSRTSASVSWNTNEMASGSVYFSTQPLVLGERINGVDVAGATVVMTDTSLRASQYVTMGGLQPNTTYYYMVYTTDMSGNVTVSWPSTFRTTN